MIQIMKTKRSIAILLSVVLLLTIAFTGCTENEISVVNKQGNDTEIRRVVSGLSERISYSTLQELLEQSDYWGSNNPKESGPCLVVIGELIDETKSGFEYDEELVKLGFDGRSDAAAYNQLRVTEVFQGNIKVGDIIPIVQSYAYEELRDGGGGISLVSFDDMTPMNKGDRWIYFLRYKEYANAYGSIGLSDGRYPVPNTEIIKVMDEFSKETSKYYEDNSKESFNLLNESRCKALKEIDVASLGVLNKNDFNFIVYAQLLDHFKIQPQDRVNPGRDFDAKLVEIVEKQFQESYAECLD